MCRVEVGVDLVASECRLRVLVVLVVLVVTKVMV